MTNDSKRSNPFTRAIYEALLAAESVALAISEAETEFGGELSDDPLQQVEELRQGDLTPESFTKEKINILRDLAARLDPRINEETTSWVVLDECDLSGGYRETSTSPQGQALIMLRSSFLNLAKRLSDVVKLQEAERLAGTLRE
ncbi:MULTISPECIES: hypothetical protein [Roseobacteraceae]|uniref:hypothetical protein n=1 Tax=Roseobacteraceae TaxID=2854170 RepID=UPI002B27065D|nr:MULTISPECIES: hypothetical protein [Roseobacteraceae]